MRKIAGIPELKNLVGQRIGESPWIVIDQDVINLFADATHDHNFIHVDPVKAAETPFAGTIGHGYHSLALIGGLIQQAFHLDKVRMGLNYGIEKARFPQAVPVGSKVRLVVELTKIVDSDTDDGADCYYHMTTEVDGFTKPACAADVIFRYYPELEA